MKQYVLIGIAGFVLAVIGKHFLLDSPHAPATDDEAKLPQVQLRLQEPCNLHEAACIASNGQGRSVTFSISPQAIPLMKDLQVSAEVSGVENIRSARVTVEGVNMFMGYQYVDMQPESSGKLNGKLILPVCSMEKMQWKATLELVTDTEKIIAAYPFDTAHK